MLTVPATGCSRRRSPGRILGRGTKAKLSWYEYQGFSRQASGISKSQSLSFVVIRHFMCTICLPDVSIRILIVDDNEVFRRPLQRTLEAAGCEVVTVASGEDALHLLARSPVDLVLTDHHLPGMDGVHLITRIKAIHPAVAIIVMTAHGTIESAVEARRHGADDYLVKPFAMPDLLSAIHRALERQQSPARAASSGEPWPK